MLLGNSPFPIFRNYQFQNETKCFKPFLRKWVLLHCFRIKNHCRINVVVLSLALKQRLGANGLLASKFNCGIACLRCFSATGKSGSKQPLSLGKGCTTKGVVIHELLHALGMMHEHCRADRDQFIRINFKNVRPSKWNELLNGFYVKFWRKTRFCLCFFFNFPLQTLRLLLVAQNSERATPILGLCHDVFNDQFIFSTL